MTIRKGEQWGHSVARPDGLVLAANDHALAELLAAGDRAPAGVAGGDMYRSVGAPGSRDTVMLLPIDLLRVIADGTKHVAVAHVVARRSWWRGDIVGVMNVDHFGEWNAAPRAHPNDGRFDVIEVDEAMTIRQRLQARSRLRHGTHTPHPGIATRTGTEVDWHFVRPMQLWIDGVHTGSVANLKVRIEADAAKIHV